MPSVDDRHVPLQGAVNFRDVGGFVAADGRRVRRGVLYRSDSLARLTDADLCVVDQIGLRTVVDLRTKQERASGPDRLPKGRIRCVHLPMRDPSAPDSRIRLLAWLIRRGPSVDFDAVLRRLFMAFAFQCTESVGALLRIVADPANLPALVHCNAGKDRTGFTMAVVLSSLGVSAEDVIADHVRTNELLLPSIPRYVNFLRWLSLGRVSEQQVMPLLEARADHLEHVFAQIHEKHGSLQTWLERACGVDLATQQRLAVNLLTEG